MLIIFETVARRFYEQQNRPAHYTVGRPRRHPSDASRRRVCAVPLGARSEQSGPDVHGTTRPFTCARRDRDWRVDVHVWRGRGEAPDLGDVLRRRTRAVRHSVPRLAVLAATRLTEAGSCQTALRTGLFIRPFIAR